MLLFRGQMEEGCEGGARIRAIVALASKAVTAKVPDFFPLQR